MKKKHQWRRWIILGLAVTFAFYEYFLRVTTSVMVPELMQAFNVDATALGALSAFYLYAYGPMQLPVGILMDRFGARKLLTFAAFVCGIGGVIFGFAIHIGLAEIGRLLIGLGSSFAFIGMIYICSHWFADLKPALLIGVGNSIAMMGAVAGEGPLSFAVDAFGWRITSISFGLVGFLISFVIFIAIRKEPAAIQKHAPISRKPSKIFENLITVCSNTQTWINGIVSVGIYATTVAFAGLWAVPFLSTAYGMSKGTAGFASSMVYVGWLVGGPCLGYLSDHLKRRKPILLISSLLGLIFILPVIYYPYISHLMVFTLLFLVGVISGSQLLTYSFAVELNPKVKGKGTPIALTNFLVMVAGSILQPLIGYMLDTSSDQATDLGDYSIYNYQIALLTIPASFVVAFIFSFFLKENPGHHPETPRAQEV